MNLITVYKSLIYYPLFLYFHFVGGETMRREMNRWYNVLPINKYNSYFQRAIFLLSTFSEFRSLLYYRCKTKFLNPIKKLYPPQTTLFIDYSQKIGAGLVISHGFSTILNCELMGENCQIWQNVTIGKRHTGKDKPRPIIGNNVKICSHAVVLGGICIGDNVTIGAGSVIVKDVPSNCIVVGNPARIIVRNGVRCNERL